jgi:hypothetical protein
MMGGFGGRRITSPEWGRQCIGIFIDCPAGVRAIHAVCGFAVFAFSRKQGSFSIGEEIRVDGPWLKLRGSLVSFSLFFPFCICVRFLVVAAVVVNDGVGHDRDYYYALCFVCDEKQLAFNDQWVGEWLWGRRSKGGWVDG